MTDDTFFDNDYSPVGNPHASPMQLLRRSLRKRLWVGIVIFIIAAPAAVGLAWLKYRPCYRVEAIVHVKPTRPRILYRTRDEEQNPSYHSFFYTEMAKVASRPVLHRCLSDPGIASLPLLADAEDPLRALKEALEVKRVGGTEFFTVSLRSQDKLGLDYAVNAVVDSYLAYREEEEKENKNKRQRLLIDERDKLRQDLDSKQKAVNALRDEIASDANALPVFLAQDPVSSTKHDISEAQTLVSTLQEKLAILKDKLAKDDLHIPSSEIDRALERDPEIQRLTGIEMQLRQALVTADAEAANPPMSLIQERINSEPEIRAFKQEIARRQLEVAAMSQNLTAEHPSLKKAQTALAESRRCLEEMEKSVEELVRNDVIESARLRAKELRSQLAVIEERIKKRREEAHTEVMERLKKDVRADTEYQVRSIEGEIHAARLAVVKLNERLKEEIQQRKKYNLKAAELKRLEEERDRIQADLRRVEERYHELEVEAGAPGYVSLQSRATEPKAPEPYKAKRLTYAGMGVVGALVIAMLVMVLLERSDDTIWSEEDLVGAESVQLLGSVPDGGRRLRSPQRSALVCVSDPGSLFAEQVRNVATGVLYPTDGKPAKTVLVTSAAPGDGKTTMAVNLATCISGLGKSVLLIDANFRKPDIAGVFRLGNIPGLGDILAYESSVADAAHTIDGVNIITAGTPPNHPGVLGASAMEELLKQAGKEHDYVIIDAPPLMLADARILAPMVDGVVCTFRALTSRRGAVRESLSTLHRLGARTLGVVLTGVNIKHDGLDSKIRALDEYSQRRLTGGKLADEPES